MRWQCNDAGCYLQRRTDLVMFDGCFPPGVAMGDVDAIVELRGKFLVLEFKRNGRNLPTGQRLLHDRWIAQGSYTIIVVTAIEQHVTGWTIRSATNPDGRTYEGDADTLAETVWRWARWADPRTPDRPPSMLKHPTS